MRLFVEYYINRTPALGTQRFWIDTLLDNDTINYLKDELNYRIYNLS